MQVSLLNLPKRNRGNHLDQCRTVALSSNLFQVDFNSDLLVSIFSLKTQPPVPMESTQRFRTLVINNPTLRQAVGPYVISGRTLFTQHPQKIGLKEELSVGLTLQETRYTVTLKLVKQVQMGDLRSANGKQAAVVYQFLNNMVRNFFYQLHYTEIGSSRKYFDPSSEQNLKGANVKIYKGFSTSFLMLEKGLFCRVQPTVKVVQTETAMDAINRIYKINESLSRQEKRTLLEQFFVGKMVMANYGRRRCYVIDSVSFNDTVESYTIDCGNKQLSLLEYYKETYDIDISAKRQPLFKARAEKSRGGSNKENVVETLLVPELMQMSGLPDDFDERQRRQLSDFTIVTPSDKLNQINGFFEQLQDQNETGFNTKTISQSLGIKIAHVPGSFNAKQLKLPELTLGGHNQVDQCKATCFNLFDKNLYNSKVKLSISCFHEQNFKIREVKNLMDSTCAKLGLKYELTSHVTDYRDRKVLSEMEKTVMRECQKGSINLFWFIIPPSLKTRYRQLKEMTMRTGMERKSQVSLTKTFEKGFQSVVTKVLLQMAAKVGNVLWLPKVSPPVSNARILLIGIEETSNSFEQGQKVVSYCSNNTPCFDTFYSGYMHSSSDPAAKNYTARIVSECLVEFVKQSGTQPKNVIVLKNGTVKCDLAFSNELQINEITGILNSMSSVGRVGAPIHLIYMLLDKNSSQKFFLPKNPEVVNPMPGTLVNSEAVGKGFEFYLIAQQSRKGAVKPTFYRVIYSDSALEEGLLEELIFAQCFNYMNWLGSIKVPAVMQYAKKLGTLVGTQVQQKSVDDMKNQLYFI